MFFIPLDPHLRMILLICPYNISLILTDNCQLWTIFKFFNQCYPFLYNPRGVKPLSIAPTDPPMSYHLTLPAVVLLEWQSLTIWHKFWSFKTFIYRKLWSGHTRNHQVITCTHFEYDHVIYPRASETTVTATLMSTLF